MGTRKGVAVLAILAGVVLTPRIMPGNPLAGAVEWVVDGVRGMALGAADLGAQASEREATQEPFRWAGAVDAGDAVEIRGINGSVEAVPTDGDRVVVVAEKRSRRSDVAEVRIEVVEHAGGVTVCAVYPAPRGEADNGCAPGGEGRTNVRNNDVSVHFRVEVPRDVRFDARTVNGDVTVEGLASDVDAKTVNGDVEITTTGFARAATVNGSIRAAMGRWMPEGAEFETVNGSIELDLPDDVDADLDASWVNGSLDSDLPLMLEGRVERRRVAGRLGDGGPDLDIKTVNGSIRIR